MVNGKTMAKLHFRVILVYRIRCGQVDREVAFNPRGPGLQSSHQQC